MGLTFAAFARVIMDFIISTCFNRNMRRTFARATIKVSADFSDLKEGLEAIKKQREMEEPEEGEGML